jgi:nucleoside-diphosphate-sugar epimerase
MTKKYLVTGGTGFIGSALVRSLLREGHAVRVLDNNTRGSQRRLSGVEDQIEMIEGDIRDVAVVESALAGVDAVCHLAYINGTEFFYSNPELVLEVAVKGMMNLLDGCISQGVGEFVLASSSEVYQTPPVVPTDETAPLSVPDVLNPRYSYGGGKIICELLAMNYGRKHFDRVVIFRPHNVYGPDMGWEHVLPQFIMRMKGLSDEPGEPLAFSIQGTGQETRAFIYIDDFTNGLLRVIEKGEHLNVYHIGTQEELTIEAVAQEVGRFFNRDVQVLASEATQGSTLRRCPDISKLKQLGFKPNVAFREGVAKMAQWYVRHENLKPSEQEIAEILK